MALDNGTEFARHCQIHQLEIETLLCDVRSHWQRCGVGNRIGRLRRYLPRRTVLSALLDLRLAQLAEADNATPRKCLGCLTASEIYSNPVLFTSSTAAILRGLPQPEFSRTQVEGR